MRRNGLWCWLLGALLSCWCVGRALAGSSVGHQPYNSTVNTMGAPSAPSFSFTAPAAGDYATLTAATGQTISCSRASTATYLTSATAMATAASNRCRVDYRGLLIEEARTNSVLRSEATDNAAWTQSAATVLANQGVWIDGNTSMDKETSSSNLGQFFQLAASTATVSTVSGWASTTSGTQTISLGVERQTGTATSACTCSLPSGCSAVQSGGIDCLAEATIGTTPTRLAATITTSTAVTGFYLEASPGPWGAAGNSGAIALFDGLQEELGATFATSYIATAGTAVTRSQDVIDVGAITLSATPSFSATVNPEGFLGATTQVLHLTTAGGATNSWQMYLNGSGTVGCRYDATTDTSSATVAVGAATKVSCSYDGAKIKTCVAGVCDAGTAATVTTTSFSHFYVGNFNGSSNALDGYLSALCAAKTSTGCPP